MKAGTFLKGSAALGAAEIASKASLFLFTAIFARHVGLSPLAQVALAQGIYTYATVAADGGLSTHAVRRLAAGDPERQVIRETTSTQTAVSVLGVLLLMPVVFWITDSATITLVLALTPIAISLSPTYLLQARSAMNKLALSRVAGAVTTAGIGSALAYFLGTPFAAIAYTFGALVTMTSNIRLAGTSVKQFLKRLTLRVKHSWIVESRWLIGQTLIVHAYASTLLVVGSLFLTTTQFTNLAIALRLQLVFLIAAAVIQSVMLPLFTSRSRNPWRIYAAVVAASSTIPAIVWIFAPEILVVAFGTSADAAAHTLKILALQLPLAYGNTVLLTFLVALGEYGRTTAVYAFALVTQIVIAVPTATLGSTAMATALVVSEVVFTIGLVSILDNKTFTLREVRYGSG